ncbi:MAG: MFS transporter [Candidatus Bathyarchaeia archaeon]
MLTEHHCEVDVVDPTGRRLALLITTVGSFTTPFMSASINIALPTISLELEADILSMSWIATSFLLALAISLLPFGKLSDIYGRKMVFKYGLATYTGSSLLCALSGSVNSLILFRILQGVGSAMVSCSSVAILTSVFPVGLRGRALGVNVAAVYSGLSLGPFLGGLLTQNLGWRSIFIMNVLAGLMLLVCVMWKLRGEWVEAEGERFDFLGSIIWGLSLTGMMYGFSLLPTVQGISMILLGVLGVCVFIVWESKVETPLLEMEMFKSNRVFTFSNLAALINYSATFAVSFLLSLYLQYVKGLDPQTAGLILIFQPVVQTVFSPIAGRLSDRIEPRLVASTGMALTTIGLGIFTIIGGDTTIDIVAANLSILGFGFALFSSPNTNAVMSSVNRRFYGVASATLGTMRFLGQMLSMGVVTIIFTLHMEGLQVATHPDMFLKSCRILFIVFTVICCLGVFASLVRGRLRP